MKIIFLLSVFIFSYIRLNTILAQQYTIQQYLKISGAASPGYSFDDSRIYFTMRKTGTSQIYYVNNPGDIPVQFTYFNERITGYSPNPVNGSILIESDEGGSEYDRFYLTNQNGSAFNLITADEPNVLNGFGKWSPDGSFFTYYSNKRSPYFYDIYKYEINLGAGEIIYSSDNSNFTSVISPDGNLIIITRSYSTFDNDLYLLNRKSNDLTLLTGHDNYNSPAEFYASDFDADAENLYIITNYKSDFFKPCIINISSKKLSFPQFSFLKPYSNNEVQRLVISPDKNYMLIQINDNGYDRLFMCETNSGKEIKLPDILSTLSITAISFANQKSKVIIGVNSAANPSVLYEWDFITGNVLQVTKPDLAGIDPVSFIEPSLISYKSFDGLEIPCFIYKPQNLLSKKLPCIIMIHGGPESQATYGFEPVFQYFLNAGYVIAEPNVRGSSGYGKIYAALDNVRNRENSVKDIAFLVEYLKLQPEIESSKIAVYGGSYGGYMVLACLTLYPELFAAGVDVVGISNFVSFLQNTSDYRKNNRQSEYGSIEDDREFLESISPLNKVNNIKAPLMIIHGRNDPRVPVSEAEQMYNAVINNGGIAELHIYEDEGHGISKQKNRLDLYPKIVEFLNKNLK